MTPVWLAIIVIAAGIWNIVDGIGSIIYYWRQSPQEHLVRVIRILIGASLLIVLHYAWGMSLA